MKIQNEVPAPGVAPCQRAPVRPVSEVHARRMPGASQPAFQKKAPGRIVWVAVFAICLGRLGIPMVSAQGVDAGPFANREIESITIKIDNPSQDEAVNARAEDTVRRVMGLFPGSRYSEDFISFAMSQARRSAGLANIRFEATLTPRGGVDLVFYLELPEAARAPEGRGYVITRDPKDLPVIYDRNGTFLKLKVEALGLYYGNNNAWYGRPDLMLAGNPLVKGQPAGKGYDDWVEGYVHYGLYGITPLTTNLYLYGGVSAISSVSYGQELFTDETREYTWFEDAYVGLLTGGTDAKGNRRSVNLTAGRQRFTLADAFLIANTAANGDERAALQANARWASDMLALAKFRYNEISLELFYVDPDELDLLDSQTRIAGVNLEAKPLRGLKLGAAYLGVPESDSLYYDPAGAVAGGREGLQLMDLRFTYTPRPLGVSGPFFGGEVARQTNRDFDMDARAAYAEIGYFFKNIPWTPAISYRPAYFSGDDPDTETYERWDPLLSGGTGEQWVQGANHFKVVQDSNVIAHRFQARLNVAPKIQLVPQYWIFQADSLNNIGGNPALSTLADNDYGQEFNITFKYFHSKNIYVHGHIAYTIPGTGVNEALGYDAKDWTSFMLFVRYAL